MTSIPLTARPTRGQRRIAALSELADRQPMGVTVDGLDLVLVRRGDDLSVLYGRCAHRGALLADGHVDGDNLLCGLHGWDYRIPPGVSPYNNPESLEKFTSWLDGDRLLVDGNEVADYLMSHPQPFDPDVYQGYYHDPHGVHEEPFVGYIHELEASGLTTTGHHGRVSAMGVSREQLPEWDSIQFVPAQRARLPLLDEVEIGTEVCIGPNADKPMWLDI